MALLKYFDGTAWKGLDGVAVAASSRSADATASPAVEELTREVETLRGKIDALNKELADLRSKVN
jgi:cell division protein FtsB